MTKSEIEPGKKVIMKTPTYRKEGKTKVITGKFESVKVEIIEMMPKSRTKCTVRVIERGPGWSDHRQRYLGFRDKHGWSRGERKDFGEVYDTRIDNLVEIEETI